MKAIILAAGRDYELKNVLDVPKTLLKVGSKTILERQIDALKKAGLKDENIFVIAGYKNELIKKIHNNIIINNKYEELGNAYSVYLGLEKLNSELKEDEEILICDGDLVYDEELIQELMNSKKENILVTKEVEFKPKFEDEIILVDDTSLIIKMTIPIKGQPLNPDYKNKKLHTYMGIMKIKGKEAKKLRDNLSNPAALKGWYTLTLINMIDDQGFYNLTIPKSLKFCFDVDDEQDIKKLKELNLLNNKTDENIEQQGYRMFVAGPVNVSEEVKKATVYSEIGHREPEFSNLFKNVREKLIKVFRGNEKNYSAVVIGGSGTSATETLLSSILHDDKKLLVVANGAFGERINEICELHGLTTSYLHYEWGEFPKLDEIEARLKEDPTIEAVSMVLMETSTGMLNPVRETGELCKKYDKSFIVDAISALGGEPLDMVKDNVDYCLTNTNKCLGGLPVLGIICYKKSIIEKSKDVKPRSYYLDFFKYIKYSDKENQTPFTPQIPLFYMLDEALNQLIKEGLENRWKRYKNNGDLLKKRFKEMGFKFQLKEQEMSNLMVNVLTPNNYTFKEFHDKLKERGYIFYPGKGPLLGKVLHFANIGTLTEKDIIEFCKNLKEIVEEKPVEY